MSELPCLRWADSITLRAGELGGMMQIKEEKSYRQNTWVFMVLALFIGLFLIIGAHYLGDAESFKETLRDLAKELGIVLISVWGVSLFYEYVLAERHFQKFQSNLEYLI